MQPGCLVAIPARHAIATITSGPQSCVTLFATTNGSVVSQTCSYDVTLTNIMYARINLCRHSLYTHIFFCVYILSMVHVCIFICMHAFLNVMLGEYFMFPRYCPLSNRLFVSAYYTVRHFDVVYEVIHFDQPSGMGVGMLLLPVGVRGYRHLSHLCLLLLLQVLSCKSLKFQKAHTFSLA